jgi:hypothetical protein
MRSRSRQGCTRRTVHLQEHCEIRIGEGSVSLMCPRHVLVDEGDKDPMVEKTIHCPDKRFYENRK